MGFSPIHLLSVYTLYALTSSVLDARAGRIMSHRTGMRRAYISLCVAATFTSRLAAPSGTGSGPRWPRSRQRLHMTPNTRRRGLITMLVCTGIAWALHAGTGVPVRPWPGLRPGPRAHRVVHPLDAVHHRIWPEDQQGAHGFLSADPGHAGARAGAVIRRGHGHRPRLQRQTPLSAAFSRWAPSLLFNSGLADRGRRESSTPRRCATSGDWPWRACSDMPRKPQLQMLQTQLEPHMLFNTRQPAGADRRVATGCPAHAGPAQRLPEGQPGQQPDAHAPRCRMRCSASGTTWG